MDVQTTAVPSVVSIPVATHVPRLVDTARMREPGGKVFSITVFCHRFASEDVQTRIEFVVWSVPKITQPDTRYQTARPKVANPKHVERNETGQSRNESQHPPIPARIHNGELTSLNHPGLDEASYKLRAIHPLASVAGAVSTPPD